MDEPSSALPRRLQLDDRCVRASGLLLIPPRPLKPTSKDRTIRRVARCALTHRLDFQLVRCAALAFEWLCRRCRTTICADIWPASGASCWN